MTNETEAAKKPNPNEGIKAESHHLRGTIAQDMADTSTGAISENNAQLTKFHGLYLQDDRDQRIALKRAGKEKAYQFMLRVRLPGGRATPQQWLVLDKLAGEVASPSLRLTTRQTFQFHGVLKGNVKKLVQGMHPSLLDSIAACGDVNRNVMAPPNPERSPSCSRSTSRRAPGASSRCRRPTPTTKSGSTTKWSPAARQEAEPMYGATYLPRKFKTGFVAPALQRRRHLFAGPRLHRHRRERASSSATTSRSAAASA